RRSLPGQDRHSQIVAEASLGNQRCQETGRRRRSGAAGISNLGVDDDASEDLFAAGAHRREARAFHAARWAIEAVGQPARAAEAVRDEFSRVVGVKQGAPVNSREVILGNIRGALGRAAGHAPAPLAAPSLRIPLQDRNLYTSLFAQNLEKLAG